MGQFTPMLPVLLACCLGIFLEVQALPADPRYDSANMLNMLASLGNKFPVGDPRRCMDLLRLGGESRLRRFEVLPGSGWDNLQNLPQSQVISFNFSQCRTTDDGRFLLPDTVSATPVKTSRIESFAEFIDDYKDWTSVDSYGVNVDAGGLVKEVILNGKFSWDYQQVKKRQVEDKTVTMRAQVRYVRYAVQLQPDTPLHPVFRARVLDLAAAHQLNETDQARYLAQLLVRDFGTHVITGALAGAALVKVDQLSQDFVKQNIDKKTSITAAASASLLGAFGFSTSASYNTDQTFMQSYRQALSSSTSTTMGGPIYQPVNFTINEWAAQMDKDLVALDRYGLPLDAVLTPSTLPDVPVTTLRQMTKTVRRAVETYYRFNRVPGCMDPESPNFSPAANVDDGSCRSPVANLTFGGVYQTCVMQPGSTNGDLCGDLAQKNPLTGDYSCPEGHEAVQLHQGSMASSSTQHSCDRFWFVSYNCKDIQRFSMANYTAYWCVATDSDTVDDGYLFGGVYTSQSANPVTQQVTCPPHFQVVHLGSRGDLHVCVSDDYEMAVEYSVPFAGFSSCSAGNPLAEPKVFAGNASSNASIPWIMIRVGNESGQSPHGCPVGYSQHLATVDQDCEIDYCVATNALNAQITTPVKRPPFMHVPPVRSLPVDNQVMFDRDSHTWYKNGKAQAYSTMVDLMKSSAVAGDKYDPDFLVSSEDFRSWLQESQARLYNRTIHLAFQDPSPPVVMEADYGLPPQTNRDTSVKFTVTPTVAAGIGIVSTLAFVILVALGVMGAQALRRRQHSSYSRHQDVTSVKE